MGLSSDLLSQFAKVTKDTKKTNKETTVYGTVKEYDNKLYVQIDGSDLLTPSSSTAGMKNGERVIVQIKDHSATVIGNITSPSASSEDITNVSDDIIIVRELIAKKVDTETFETVNATISGRLTAAEASINSFKSYDAEITNLKTTKLDASTAEVTYATIDSLNSTNSEITNLKATKLDATSAELIYANIDFANIGMAAVEKLFTKSGIIKDLVVGDTNITGELIGVTIKGDLIQSNTVVADKLIIQGDDGLYYKLNTDGIKVETEQTDYNSLNGSVIAAKSITASKISVNDLVAFGATIGGFKITENSIYSGAKTSATNTTTGVFFGDDGQMAVGDATNFVKYYKNQNGEYKLEISADSINLSSNNTNIETVINDLQEQVNRINEYCNFSSS